MEQADDCLRMNSVEVFWLSVVVVGRKESQVACGERPVLSSGRQRRSYAVEESGGYGGGGVGSSLVARAQQESREMEQMRTDVRGPSVGAGRG